MERVDIERYLGRLSDALSRRNVVGEIVIFGGAAMVLAHKARVSTKDVDAVFEPKSTVYDSAAEVTRDHGAPDGWLNDAVKGFLSGRTETRPLLDLPALKVFVAAPEYLLAMKCMSMRIGKDETDVQDVRFLMRHLDLNDADAVLSLVEKYYPRDQIQPRTRFAILEICQEGPKP
jgi:hypothetical protein